MAKAQPPARKRRAYEYDHHYDLALAGGTDTKAGRASRVTTAPRPAKARSTKRSAKKR